MGMPCEVNSVLKLSTEQGYPDKLSLLRTYKGIKQGYRILPVDVPIDLVDSNWISRCQVIVEKLVWTKSTTEVHFKVYRFYSADKVLEKQNLAA
jgi:hypothetical protein